VLKILKSGMKPNIASILETLIRTQAIFSEEGNMFMKFQRKIFLLLVGQHSIKILKSLVFTHQIHMMS